MKFVVILMSCLFGVFEIVGVFRIIVVFFEGYCVFIGVKNDVMRNIVSRIDNVCFIIIIRILVVFNCISFLVFRLVK